MSMHVHGSQAVSAPMRRLRPSPRRLLILLVMACSLIFSSCALGTSGGLSAKGKLAGSLADINLRGQSVAVGSKNFTEQLVLGKIAVILLKSAGADVNDLTNIPGSSSARQALLSGQIDFLWEYTGTGWISYLGHSDPITDPQQQYVAVRDEDLAKNHMVWLPPAPMNNTYGFAITQKTKDRLGVSKLSDLAALPSSELSFCVESELNSRNDGFEPMAAKYDLSLGQVQRKVLDTGAIYSATADGLCNFGEVFTTDGRIKALNLTVLEDDRHFFPNYNVSPVMRQKTYNKAADQYRELFDPVSKALTNDALLAMNAEVDVQGREPADVAYDWLIAQGFITKPKS
ncbi:glycine betaine ABC transporter substrate-binding protein [Propionibacterium freudenreichii]|uniref:glycine betaine ABC transporter substrate-binding protein n=1 Tax=Propionibacterium freudenreichii TaxID=1744 RepID=UPI0005443652|nr:glycine betaine ABC transporter substrate-binding protein [Propionibacterium freudenreichii]WBF60334.1 glycine betaine ABC transporter substrate-binding protein [Propionibacterium freudenreichii]WBF63194.1 glycine betaine ABC transporter substrate-binding protein [Propionibacterium freudenreichii]CEH09513.1 binding protein of choline ABC transporter [Propionibacterium freudenreichii]SBW77280.1 ProXL [Propionibacterium freudenreichii]